MLCPSIVLAKKSGQGLYQLDPVPDISPVLTMELTNSLVDIVNYILVSLPELSEIQSFIIRHVRYSSEQDLCQ